MADEHRPRDAEIEDVSARLNDALKSCHSVVANYKALLATAPNGLEPVESVDSSQSDAASETPPDAASTGEG